MTSIVLVFRTEEERNWFLGQLSDGVMENMIDIRPLSPNDDFSTTSTFIVEQAEDEADDDDDD